MKVSIAYGAQLKALNRRAFGKQRVGQRGLSFAYGGATVVLERAEQGIGAGNVSGGVEAAGVGALQVVPQGADGSQARVVKVVASSTGVIRHDGVADNGSS